MVALNVIEGISTNNKGQQVPGYDHNGFNIHKIHWSIIGSYIGQ